MVDPDTFHRSFFIDCVLSFCEGSYIFVCLNRQWRDRYRALYSDTLHPETLLSTITNRALYEYSLSYDLYASQECYALVRSGCFEALKCAIRRKHIGEVDFKGLLITAVENDKVDIASFLIYSGASLSSRALCLVKSDIMGHLLLQHSTDDLIRESGIEAAMERSWDLVRFYMFHSKINILFWSTAMSFALQSRKPSIVAQWINQLKYIAVDVREWIHSVDNVFYLSFVYGYKQLIHELEITLLDIATCAGKDVQRIINEIYENARRGMDHTILPD